MNQPLTQRTDALLRRLLRKRAAGGVRKILAKTRPEDIAAAMAAMTATERRSLFKLIGDLDAQADVMASLREELVAELTRDMTEEHVVDLLDRMDPDDATDVVEALPDELRARVLLELDDDDQEVHALLAWPSDSAGGLMSPLVFKMPEKATCGEAIQALQNSSDEFETVFYVYVVGPQDRLRGVVSLRALLVHPARTPLVSIMEDDVIAVGPRQDQEDVARYVARYDLLAVPVVDEQQRLLGIVTVDDVVDVIREEAVEDMLRLAGVQDDVDLSQGSAFSMARVRAAWLLATACGGILADRVIGLFDESVPIEVLAGMIPVVMGMGGNVGIQSTTIAVRGLATGVVQLSGFANFVFREFKVGLMLGVTYGMLLGLYNLALGWPDPRLAFTVGFSVFLAITVGGVLGSGLPVLLQRLGADPAVATGPVVTTCLDVMGILVYFTVARVALGM